MRRLASLVLLIALATGCTQSSGTTPSASRGPVGGTLRLGMANGSFFGMDPRDEWNAST